MTRAAKPDAKPDARTVRAFIAAYDFEQEFPGGLKAHAAKPDALPPESYRFTVPGQPVPWARAGRKTTESGKTFSYSPPGNVAGEVAVRSDAAMVQMRPIRGAVGLRVVCFFAIPVSWSQKKKQRARAGLLRPTVKPDWDNLGKLVSDALNHLGYEDDSQVVEGHVEKWYSDEPRTEIEVWALRGEPLRS